MQLPDSRVSGRRWPPRCGEGLQQRGQCDSFQFRPRPVIGQADTPLTLMASGDGKDPVREVSLDGVCSGGALTGIARQQSGDVLGTWIPGACEDSQCPL